MGQTQSVPSLLLILHERRATQNLITRPDCCTWSILLSALPTATAQDDTETCVHCDVYALYWLGCGYHTFEGS